jgi:putative heme transporter
VVGAVWILSLTQTIVAPVITAAVVAAVTSPLVAWLERRGLARGLGAALLLVGVVVLAAAVVVIVVGGITGQVDDLRAHLSSAKDRLAGWLTDLGVDRGTAETAKDDASSALSSAVPALLEGVGAALKRLSSLVVFLSFTALSLFFLLKDGPLIRRWAESHMRVPRPTARGISDRVLQSLRGYFLGVTIVAGLQRGRRLSRRARPGRPARSNDRGDHLFGRLHPLSRRMGSRNFRRSHRTGRRWHGCGDRHGRHPAARKRHPPANGAADRLRRSARHPPARGAHVTIPGGSLFGAVGLILAAPLTSAATRIAADLARSRAATSAPEPEPRAAGET